MKKRSLSRDNCNVTVDDFIDLLNSSVRADHFVLTANPNERNPETADQVVPESKSRGVPRLRCELFVEKDDPKLTEDEMENARRILNRKLAFLREAEIALWESLKDLIKNTQENVANGGLRLPLPASKILNKTLFNFNDALATTPKGD